jgi:hypothetical protein
MIRGLHTLTVYTFLLCAWLLPGSSQAQNSRIVIPLNLDYKLLDSLLVSSGYFGEDLTAMITGASRECVLIKISQPQYSTSRNGLMLLKMKLFVSIGSPVNGQCIVPVEWQGYLELVQRPEFDGNNFTLSFRTIGSRLYDQSHQPAEIAGFFWQFVEPELFAYLNRIRFNLAPPVAELRSFLEPLFDPGIQQVMKKTLDSLRGGEVSVNSIGLVLELQAKMPQTGNMAAETERKRMTVEERKEVIALWEKWDALLVQLLTIMAVNPVPVADQNILLDVLLEIRHGFVSALEQDDLEEDLVRSQFINAWQRLAPLFRQQLYSRSSENLLGYFAFFSAADALQVFDRMGAGFGLDISEQGLLQLVRMLRGHAVPLDYTPELDEKLRNFLNMPEIRYKKIEPPDVEGLALPRFGPLGFLLNVFATPVFAAERKPLPSFKEILRWKVPAANPELYVKRVRSVLDDALEAIFKRKTIPRPLQAMYRELIPATAWQESCFRQFEVRNEKLTYLLSYNGSSVGLMQINERVWRGFYDLNQLRWDIRYNALAGCEIVELYLKRYVLQNEAKKWLKGANQRKLAQLLYAMYNGGPGQYEKFQKRLKSGKVYQSDRLFLEKYMWVHQNDWQQVKLCMTGG